MTNAILFKPIGYIVSNFSNRYESPRQGVLAGDEISVIELEKNKNFEQALKDIEGFDRIWVLFGFHLNSNWKPMVNPPMNSDRKVGLFATRSPHRPNPIGMSCVKLIKIEGLKIFISESDILDGSPVFDIKPYLPYSDSFPDAKAGWTENKPIDQFKILFNENVSEQFLWLKNNAGIDLENFCKIQLTYNPAESLKKRIYQNCQTYIIAFRTWRISYVIDNNLLTVNVDGVFSGYTEEELNDSSIDKYSDKNVHRLFKDKFN